MSSWANLAVDAAELSGAPIDEARIRAAFAGADEEWKRSAALSLGAAAGQRAAEAAVVLATITLRLSAVGVYARSDAEELLAIATALRKQSAAAAELAQLRLERASATMAPSVSAPGEGNGAEAPALRRPARIISFPEGK